LPVALAFIEEAHAKGGKVLVHCRVGVSRSATIVIAHVMKALRVDLATAYLITRSRRLNILIQPNCRIMWELWTYEGQLAREELQAGLGDRGTRMGWSTLSKCIGVLNERYSC
jgi:dual specificity MAP kinase phosphatase